MRRYLVVFFGLICSLSLTANFVFAVPSEQTVRTPSLPPKVCPICKQCPVEPDCDLVEQPICPPVQPPPECNDEPEPIDCPVCPVLCDVVDCLGNLLPESSCIYDKNDDGVVDTKDSLTILQYLNEIQRDPEFPKNPSLDVNGDGEITPLDSLLILSYIRELGVNCDATPTPTPSSECIYTFKINRIQNDASGPSKQIKAFGGDYKDLSCIDQIVKDATMGKHTATSLRAIGTRLGPNLGECIGCDVGLFDDEVHAALNFLKDRIAPFQFATWYMDEDCNFLRAKDINPQDEICGGIEYSWIPTPISLIWSDNVDIEKVGVVNEFPINPNDPGWYIWRGSELTPMLVFDPSKSGKITSGTELFGNYTFGGKSSDVFKNATLSHKAEKSSDLWADGFEALSVLDKNGDGIISGDELDSLGLWFDRNQNGKSEPGEVIPIKEKGILELRYRNTFKDSLGNIRLKSGYTVFHEGKTRTGELVDWHSDRFTSKEAALSSLQARSIASSIIDSGSAISSESSINVNSVESKSEHKAKVENDKLTVWRWKFAKDNEVSVNNNSGYLFVKEVDSIIHGASYLEVDLEKNDDKSIITSVTPLPLLGKIVQGTTGKLYDFKVYNQTSGLTTHSVAEIDGSSDVMTGNSTLRDANGTEMTYSWSAKKVGEVDPALFEVE